MWWDRRVSAADHSSEPDSGAVSGAAAVPVLWSPETRAHDPLHEVWVGKETPAVEVAERVDAIKDALREAGHDLREVGGRDDLDRVLLTVHDRGLLEFLSGAAERWADGDYDAAVGQQRVVPYLFPTPAMAAGLPLRTPTAIHAEAGTYAFDTTTLVGPGTWTAARAAAACALAAADLVLDGAPLAYALSRPPGHHATPAGYGGSCYLNNAALAAQVLRAGGHDKVAIVDVDAHHGNGTSAVFYARADVSYASVHVDPGAGWFPHYVGFADETGSGHGRGTNRNLPLPPGSGDEAWVEAVSDLADWSCAGGATALVVSLGVDAAAEDPESPLRVSAAGYRETGRLLGATGLPAVLVQEGGYHLPSLGDLVAAYVEGHTSAALGGRL